MPTPEHLRRLMEAVEAAVERLNRDADKLREEEALADAGAAQQAADVLERARRTVEVDADEKTIADLISATGMSARVLKRIDELLGDDETREHVRRGLARAIRDMLSDTIPINLEDVWGKEPGEKA